MIYHVTSKLSTLNLRSKRVLLRADLNVPLEHGTIRDDFRLISLLPTLNLLRAQGAHIILATHIGRPEGVDNAFSTKPLAVWLRTNGYTVAEEADLENAYTTSMQPTTDILLLENLRFFPGEKTHDMTFAKQLARLGDYYVNDAFSLLHEADTSITTVPSLFAPEKRSVGLLIEKELATLNKLLTTTKHPFVLICGGKKAATKIPLLEHLLPKLDAILLCPALVCTFMHAQGQACGASCVDDTQLDAARTIMRQAAQSNVQLMFPVDYQVAHATTQGTLSIKQASDIAKDDVCIAVGPQTIALWKTSIANAGTVFFNGVMGFMERPETLQASTEIFKALQMSPAFTIVGGGDSVAAVRMLNLQDGIDHLSVGGGATLAYLSGQPLPGLAACLSAS